MSIYRSDEGRAEVLAVYDRAVDALAVDVSQRRIETRHGTTHVLVCGPEDADPLLVFHGGNATNPMTLAWYTALADEYRLIAPDTIGQPGKSAPTRVPPRGDGYGEWVVDLLDAFDLTSAPAIGTSYGAGIVLRAAALAPDRLERAALVVPAGFGTGPIRSLVRVGLPAVLYGATGREWFLERVLSAMVTRPDEAPIVRTTIAAALGHVSLERTFPGAEPAELAAFDAPVAVVLAEDDPFFPAASIRPRVDRWFQRSPQVTVLADEKHVLSREAQRTVAGTIRTFLDDES